MQSWTLKQVETLPSTTWRECWTINKGNFELVAFHLPPCWLPYGPYLRHFILLKKLQDFYDCLPSRSWGHTSAPLHRCTEVGSGRWRMSWANFSTLISGSSSCSGRVALTSVHLFLIIDPSWRLLNGWHPFVKFRWLLLVPSQGKLLFNIVISLTDSLSSVSPWLASVFLT